MSEPAAAPVIVDARGLRCPWPALRLARAVREGGAAGWYRLLADDPHAAGEVAALAAGRRWRIAAGDATFDIWTTAAATSCLPDPR